MFLSIYYWRTDPVLFEDCCCWAIFFFECRSPGVFVPTDCVPLASALAFLK